MAALLYPGGDRLTLVVNDLHQLRFRRHAGFVVPALVGKDRLVHDGAAINAFPGMEGKEIIGEPFD
jgi:hypothetical protein